MMKKIAFLLLSFLLISSVSSCDNGRKSRNKKLLTQDENVADSSNADDDSLSGVLDLLTEEESPDETEQVIEFLNEFYTYTVFGEHAFTNLKRNFTPEMLERLWTDDLDNGYAVWKFRSVHDEMPGNKSKVTAITPQGDGWYTVSYIDMGRKGSKRIKAALKGSRVVIEDLK